MPMNLSELGIEGLSVDDRIALAHELWDSAARDVEHASLSEPQRHELERQLADFLARPEAVVPWEEVMARAIAGR